MVNEFKKVPHCIKTFDGNDILGLVKEIMKAKLSLFPSCQQNPITKKWARHDGCDYV